MKRITIAAAAALALSGCAGSAQRPHVTGQSTPASLGTTAPQPSAAELASIAEQSKAAEQACKAQTFRTAVARAQCYNEAEERIILPKSRNPDLVQAKMATRLSLAQKVDRRQISQAQAKAEFAKAVSQLIETAESRSNGGHLAGEPEVARR